MNILLLDIETAPNLAYVWGLYKQNISPDHLAYSSYVMCWSAKWLNTPKLHFASVQRQSPEKMLRKIHTMLNRADIVVTYNGKKFDLPTLNKEFIKHKLPPCAPFQQVDLLLACRKLFRFESNKLDYVSKSLKIGEKVRHAGHELWVGCMEGDKECWKKMEEYNRGDVLLLEKLYKELLPWLPNHPSHGVFEDAVLCPNCGCADLQRRGFAYTKVLKYYRYQCKECGSWARGSKTVTERKGERVVPVAR